jgi:hypothetical protein
MKLVAIDTNMSSLEFGGEFTRVKDFQDIREIVSGVKIEDKDLPTEILYHETIEILNLILKGAPDSKIIEYLKNRFNSDFIY